MKCRDTIVRQELAKTLQAVSEEKDKIEQRNAVLEKMATMQFTPEVRWGLWGLHLILRRSCTDVPVSHPKSL